MQIVDCAGSPHELSTLDDKALASKTRWPRQQTWKRSEVVKIEMCANDVDPEDLMEAAALTITTCI